MNLTHIIQKPVVTEKSLREANLYNRFTFEVDPRANKDQIKKAVSKQFDVTVEEVWTQTKKPVGRRTGRRRLPGVTSFTKKAIVQLQKGQSIEAFSTGAA